MAAPSITRTVLAAPTNFTATPASGGSLAASTTYYYKIIAVKGGTNLSTTVFNRGIPSSEISGTTTGSDKTIDLSWTAVSGADGYIIWRTSASGDYEHRYVDGGTDLFNCITLRSTFNAYSSKTTSYSDDGSIYPTGGYQGNSHYMYLDFPIPVWEVSDGDSSTPLNIEYLYQHDVTNGYGDITRTGGNELAGYEYEIKAFIKDNGTFYWAETKQYDTFLFWGGFDLNDTSSTILIGYETVSKEWVYGKTFKFMGHFGYYSFPQSRFRAGTNNIYGCQFIFLNWLNANYNYIDNYSSTSNLGRQNGAAQFVFDYQFNSKGNTITGAPYGCTHGVSVDSYVERCLYQAGSRTFSLGGGDFATYMNVSDIQVKSYDRTFNCERKVLTLRDGLSVSDGRGIFVAYGDTQLTLVNCIVEGDFYSFQGLTYDSSGAEIILKEYIDINVVDENGDAIEGVSVTVKNNADTLVVNTATDSNGDITRQEVTRRYFNADDNTNHYILEEEWIDYNPMTLTVSKAGKELYTTSFTLEEGGIKWQLKLKQSKYIRHDIHGNMYQALNADNKGSSAELMRL